MFGSTGGIGNALAEQITKFDNLQTLHCVNRSQDPRRIEQTESTQTHLATALDETSLAQLKRRIEEIEPAQIRLIIIATGALFCENGTGPEKSWKDLSVSKLQEIFTINTVVPAMIAKHFLPLLPRKGASVCAALSARVGSISDNKLGGWYSYRASKAALNQIIRTASIELARTHPEAAFVGIHPGTVATDLSAPFQANVPRSKLFTPMRSAEHIVQVLNRVTAAESGQIIDWAGEIVTP